MAGSIEDCVNAGRLVSVCVKIPPPEVFEVGDTWKEKPMCASMCEANSRRIVQGMNARGESDWHIVGGFCFSRIP